MDKLQAFKVHCVCNKPQYYDEFVLVVLSDTAADVRLKVNDWFRIHKHDPSDYTLTIQSSVYVVGDVFHDEVSR